MPTILIGGYYGAGNLGDEAILAAMIGELRSQRSDLSFIVTSWEPEKTTRDLGVEAIFWKDINALLDAAQRADLIILGGGGIFHDYWGIDPDTYLRKAFWDITSFGSLPLLAELLNIPCMIYAVGVGPFQTDLARQHTCLAFGRCQTATLRDVESLELLKQIGFNIENPLGPKVQVLPDPVFSLTTSPADDEQVAIFLKRRDIHPDAQLLGVSLRYWDIGMSLDEWLPYIANGVREFLARNNQARVILIPFQVLNATPHTNDAIVLKQLSDLISAPERVYLIKESLSAAFTQALIKRCTTVVGMRLHSLIMGINAGTPIVALPYAPKVSSAMKLAGLEKFISASLTPAPDDLATQIEAAWAKKQTFQDEIQPVHAELSRDARKHAALALGLLANYQRIPLKFPQEFALRQTRFLADADEKLATLENEKYFADIRLAEQSVRLTELEIRSSRLHQIESSKFWRVAKIFFWLMRETPLRYLYRFLSLWLNEGLRETFKKGYRKLKSRLWPKYSVVNVKEAGDPASYEIVNNVVNSLNDRPLKGLAILTSSFVFDELFNQRVINLSKFLSAHGWGVIYVAWRWSKAEPMANIGVEVYKNVFQIPVDMLWGHPDLFPQIKSARKYFFAEFPHPDFLISALKLRRSGFEMVYEIIDEWEEFHKVGQALWYNQSIEKALVLNANFVTAVSTPLIEKFAGIRRDIHLSPNGYTPALLGENHRYIAREKQPQKDQIHLGYFGHLTQAWFDWDFLLNVLELARQQNVNLFVHLIGYGEPDMQAKLAKYAGHIKFYGKVHPMELYKYAKDWDMALICFKTSKLSEAVDPIKVYEYLYFGLPVIAKGISHLKDFPNITVVSDEKQAVDALIALQNERQPASTEPAAEQMLARSTWEQRFTDLLEILESEKWMSL